MNLSCMPPKIGIQVRITGPVGNFELRPNQSVGRPAGVLKFEQMFILRPARALKGHYLRLLEQSSKLRVHLTTFTLVEMVP